MQAQINAFDQLDDQELQFLLDNLDQFTPEEQAEAEEIINEIAKRRESKACYDDLIEF